jgi:hypothetical protein
MVGGPRRGRGREGGYGQDELELRLTCRAARLEGGPVDRWNNSEWVGSGQVKGARVAGP